MSFHRQAERPRVQANYYPLSLTQGREGPRPTIVAAGREPDTQIHRLPHQKEQSEAINMIQHAKRVLGFSPISNNKVNNIREQLATEDTHLAMKSAVQDFLRHEMNVPESILNNLVINKVFPPASQQLEWNTLYAEFDNDITSAVIQQFARNLQPGKRLPIYVPACLQLRFSQVNALAHQLRNGPNKHKRRVKYGDADFILLKKPREGIHPWVHSSLSSLPPLQLKPTPQLSIPSSQITKSTKRTHSDEEDNRSNRPRNTGSPGVNNDISNCEVLEVHAQGSDNSSASILAAPNEVNDLGGSCIEGPLNPSNCQLAYCMPDPCGTWDLVL